MRCNPRRLGIGALWAACATTFLLAQEAEPKPATEAQPDGNRRNPFSLAIDVKGGYDDNITELSQRDIDRLENGTPSDRFRIETPDDYLAIVDADFRWKFRLLPRRETTLGAFVEAHDYQTNDIKDYEEFGALLLQELTASQRHLATFRYRFARTPYYYSRQLTDDNDSFAAGRRIREEATYAEDDHDLSLSQEFVDGRLRARLGWEYLSRDYNEHFNERDSKKDLWSLRLRGRPFRTWKMSLGATWESGGLHAVGDLASSPIPDDDISYHVHGYAFAASFPWGSHHRGHLDFDYDREFRDFTTDNPFDTSHYDRADDRRDYHAEVTQRLTPRMDLLVDYEHRSNNAAFPGGAGSLSDEATDFVEDRISLGLGWNLRF